MPTDKSRPDVRITSTVRASQLRFHTSPNVEIEFSEGMESETTSKRSGFPKPVRPEVDYHDIRIDYELTATTDVDRHCPVTDTDSGTSAS